MSRALLVVAVAGLTACSGRMPVLDPGGPQAGRIATYWWIAFWLSSLILAAVIAFLLHVVARRRVPTSAPATVHDDPARERRLAIGVAAAVGLTAVTLVVLTVTSIATGRALHNFGGTDPLTIQVTGLQWWWDIEYWDPVPSQRVRTANEIHIPVGRPVLVKTRSLDVIHSFWVPGLHGKKDNIPGHDSSLVLQADRAGTFGGRCAEFCGVQHAHMQLLVIAEPPEQFDRWLQAQRQSAAVPSDPAARHGFDLFVQGPCALCHTVLGTPAGGRFGPDLTHVASRRTLAAGTLPNTPGHLAGWIIDPQGVKPGAQMPGNSFGADDLSALLAFLGGLQ